MKKNYLSILFLIAFNLFAMSCSKLFVTMPESKSESLTGGGDSDYLPPEELVDIFLKEVVDNYYGYTDKKTGELNYFRYSADGKTITHTIVNGDKETFVKKYEYKENIGATQAYYFAIDEDGNYGDEVKVIFMENYYVMYMNNIALQNLRGYLGYDPDNSFYEDIEPEAIKFIEEIKGKSFIFRGLLTVHTYKFDVDGISIEYMVQMDGKEVLKKTVYTLDSIANDYEATFTGDGSKSVKFIANENYDELYMNEKIDANFKGYLKDVYTVPAAPDYTGKTYIKKDSDVTLFFTANGERIRYWNGTSILSTYSFDSDNVAKRDNNNFKAKFGGYNLEVFEDASTIIFDDSTYNLQSVEAPGDAGTLSKLKDLIKNQNFGSSYEVSADGETIHWTDGMQIHYFYVFVKETGISSPEGYKQAVYKEPGGNYFGVTYDEDNKRIRMSSGLGNSSADSVIYNGTWASSIPPAPEFKPLVQNKTFVSVDGARYVFSTLGNNLKIGLDTFEFEDDIQKVGDYFRAKYSGIIVEFDSVNNTVKIESKDGKWYSYAYNSPNQPVSQFKQVAAGLKYRSGESKYKFALDANNVSWNTDNYTYLEDRPDGNGTKRAVYTKGGEYFMTEVSTDGIKVHMGSGVLNTYTSTSYSGTWYNKIVDFNLFLNAVKGRSYRKNNDNIVLHFAGNGKELRIWNALTVLDKYTWSEDVDDVVIKDNSIYYSYKYGMNISADSKNMDITDNSIAWYLASYHLIETSPSSFKDGVKNLEFEDAYVSSFSGDVIEYYHGISAYAFYVFIEDATDSPEGYKRAIYQKPGGDFYGVELIMGENYKLLRMGAGGNKASVSYSGTFYITGTPPDFKSKVANKTFMDADTEARYIFNADGTVATWGVDLGFGSDEKPNGTYLTAKYSGTTFEYDVANNRVKSGKDNKWYNFVYNTPSAPIGTFKDSVKGKKYSSSGESKYIVSADGDTISWSYLAQSGTYTYVEDRANNGGSKRSVYRSGDSFYMVELTADLNKFKMTDAKGYNNITFDGVVHNRVVDPEDFFNLVKGRSYKQNGSNRVIYFSADGKFYKGWDGALAVSDNTWSGNDDDVSIDTDKYVSENFSMRVKQDSSSLEITSHAATWYKGTYTLITTSSSDFKELAKNIKYESTYTTSSSGEIIFYDDTFNKCFYVFLQDVSDSTEGYNRAVYQKPGTGGYYGVELVVGDVYKALRMSDNSSSIGGIVWSGTWYIWGTPPSLMELAKGKTYVKGSDKYIFNSDASEVTYNNTRYVFVEARNHSDGEIRAVYKKSGGYYGVSLNINASKMNMGSWAGFTSTVIFNGSWFDLQP